MIITVKLKNKFNLGSSFEFSIEVNPGTVRHGQLELWKGIGINRLSIGVQSLKDTVLKGLNRHQTKVDVIHLLQKTDYVMPHITVVNRYI